MVTILVVAAAVAVADAADTVVVVVVVIIIIKLEKSISSFKTLKHRLSFHVLFLAGNVVTRGCGAIVGLPPQDEVFKGLQERLAGRKNNDVRFLYCNDADLCNGPGAGLCNATQTDKGTGRMAEIQHL